MARIQPGQGRAEGDAGLLGRRSSLLQDIAADDSVVTLWVSGKQVARAQLAAPE